MTLATRMINKGYIVQVEGALGTCVCRAVIKPTTKKKNINNNSITILFQDHVYATVFPTENDAKRAVARTLRYKKRHSMTNWPSLEDYDIVALV